MYYLYLPMVLIAICFNSETAELPENIIEGLQLRFRHIIILYDSDETGIREAKRQTDALTQYKILSLTCRCKELSQRKIYLTSLPWEITRMT